jgi:hypothetical protein
LHIGVFDLDVRIRRGDLSFLNRHIDKHGFKAGVFWIWDKSSDWSVQNNDRNLAGSEFFAWIIGTLGKWNVHEVLSGEILDHWLGKRRIYRVLIFELIKLHSLSEDVLTLIRETTDISQNHIG